MMIWITGILGGRSKIVVEQNSSHLLFFLLQVIYDVLGQPTGQQDAWYIQTIANEELSVRRLKSTEDDVIRDQ